MGDDFFDLAIDFAIYPFKIFYGHVVSIVYFKSYQHFIRAEMHGFTAATNLNTAIPRFPNRAAKTAFLL